MLNSKYQWFLKIDYPNTCEASYAQMILHPERKLSQMTSQGPYQAYFCDSHYRFVAPTMMRYRNANVMSEDGVSVFLGVTLLNWSNTDIRNETKLC